MGAIPPTLIYKGFQLWSLYLEPIFDPFDSKVWIFLLLIFYSLFLIQEPFNAEPPRAALISSYVTPVDFFFKRNHGPIPVVDDINR